MSNFQSVDYLPNNIFTNTQCFDPSFLHLFQNTHTSNMGVCSIPRAELTSTHSRPAAFGVVARAGIVTSTGSEDSGLAGSKSRRRDEEDKVEA